MKLQARLVYYYIIALVFVFSSSFKANAANTPADFTIHSQVWATAPPGFGFNLTENGGGANIRENALIQGGGFGTYDLRMDFYASDNGAADGTTFIATGTNAAAGWWNTSIWSCINSNGVFKGALARVYRFNSVSNSWSLVRTGTVSAMTADSSSTATAAHTIYFSTTGPQCMAGDAIWLSKDAVYLSPDDPMHWVNNLDPRLSGTGYNYNWNPVNPDSWSLVQDAPAGQTNGQSVVLPLSMVVTSSSNAKAGIWQYLSFGSDNGRDQFEAGHSYTVSVWLKQSGVADGSATFNCTNTGNTPYLSSTFTGITNTWKQFTATFPAPATTPPYPQKIFLKFNGPGTLYVNQFRFYDNSHDPFTLDSRVLQTFQDFKPGVLRIWSGFGNNAQNYAYWSLDSWLEDESITRGDIGIDNSPAVAAGLIPAQQLKLPAALNLAKQLNTTPWLIGNLGWSEQEWSNFIDYLAAPAGVGYAAKRPSTHPGPYTADFSKIYVEFGNEEWGTQKTAMINAYGQFAHYMFSQAVASKSYYDPNKIKLVVNGFISSKFGESAIANCAEGQSVDYFLYTGNSTAGDAGFQASLLSQRGYQTAIDRWMASARTSGSAGHSYEVTSYEGGPGQDAPGSTSQGDHSLAVAVGTLDTYLYAQQQGMTALSLFCFRSGTTMYTSHSNFANGFRPQPVWEALSMRNQHCAGDIVATDNNLSPLTTDGQNTPLVATYTFHETTGGINYADILVLSRDLNNATPVTLHLPAAPSGPANLYTLTGDPRTNNDTSMAIPIVSSTVSGFSQDYAFTLPAGSVYLFKVPTATWPTAGPVATIDVGTGYAQLDWAAVPGAISYKIYRYTSPTGSGGTPYATVSGGVVTFLDTGVANGTTYYYRVSAVTSTGETDTSPKMVATPTSAGQVIGVNCGGASVATTLWVSDTNTNSVGNPYATGGFPSTSGTQEIPATLVNPAPQAVYTSSRPKATFTITGLTPGLPYTVRIHGSEIYYASPGQRLEDIKFNGVVMQSNVDWFTVAGAKNRAAILSYPIVLTSSSLAVTAVASNSTTDSNSCMSGVELWKGTVPMAPVNLTATAGGSQVTLNWNSIPGADSCTVKYGITSGTYTQSIAGVTGTTKTITGLTNGTKYYFQVTGTNADALGDPSVEVNATPYSDVTSGLVGRWNLDSSTSDSAPQGTVVDTGTLVGSATYTTGIVGTAAVSLSGSNQYVSVPTSTDLAVTGAVSVSVWVKTVAYPPAGGDAGLVGKWIGSGNQRSYQMQMNPTGQISFNVSSDGVSNSGSFTSQAVSLNTWTHIVGVYTPNGTSSTLQVYINGTLAGTLSSGVASSVFNSTSPVTIGSFYILGATNFSFHGMIDDARIYNRALSATEVSTIYGVRQ